VVLTNIYLAPSVKQRGKTDENGKENEKEHVKLS